MGRSQSVEYISDDIQSVDKREKTSDTWIDRRKFNSQEEKTSLVHSSHSSAVNDSVPFMSLREEYVSSGGIHLTTKQLSDNNSIWNRDRLATTSRSILMTFSHVRRAREKNALNRKQKFLFAVNTDRKTCSFFSRRMLCWIRDWERTAVSSHYANRHSKLDGFHDWPLKYQRVLFFVETKKLFSLSCHSLSPSPSSITFSPVLNPSSTISRCPLTVFHEIKSFRCGIPDRTNED